MTIPAEIYANLSTSERIRAAVSALARNDDTEIRTLKETCPKKSYLMTDPAYSEGMQRLLSLAMAVESDLRGLAIDFFLAARIEEPEEIRNSLEVMASMGTAWTALLAEMGIDGEEMSKAIPGRHHVVEKLLSIATGREHSDIVEVHLTAMRDYLAA